MKKVIPAAPVSATSTVTDLRINPDLKGKYDDQPVMKEKVRRANEILAKTGVPKF